MFWARGGVAYNRGQHESAAAQGLNLLFGHARAALAGLSGGPLRRLSRAARHRIYWRNTWHPSTRSSSSAISAPILKSVTCRAATRLRTSVSRRPIATRTRRAAISRK
ncbi:hypothetical protein EMIT0158MI4_50184 [Burkholderia ambifaria]